MLASYLLSRTLVPTLSMCLLKAPQKDAPRSRNPLVWIQKAFDRGFERFRLAYKGLLTALVGKRFLFVPAFVFACLTAGALLPRLRPDLFPGTAQGAII